MLASWKTLFNIRLNRQSDTPMYRQMEAILVNIIKDGVLSEGMRMPGGRLLADKTGISHNTVEKVYTRLNQRGFLQAKSRKGYYVRLPVEDLYYLRHSDHKEQPNTRSSYRKVVFDEGLPNVSETTPVLKVTRALKRVHDQPVSAVDSIHSLTAYQSLEETAISMLKLYYGYCLQPGQLCLLPSRMHLLNMAAPLMLRGGLVAIPSPSDPVAWSILQQWNCKIIPLDMKPSGLDLEQLEVVAGAFDITALYLNTAGYMLNAGNITAHTIKELLRISRKYRFYLLVDNPDRELWFGEYSYPLIAGDDPAGNVIYLGSLSQLMYPLNEFGLVAGPEKFIRAFRKAWVRNASPDNMEVAAAAELLIRNGTLAVTVKESLKIYRSKREQVAGLLEYYLGDYLTFGVPAAGLAFLLRLNLKFDAALLKERFAEQGIFFPSGLAHPAAEPSLRMLKMGFATLEMGEIDYALRLMKQTFAKQF